MGQFLEELRQRNILRVAIAYLAACWLLIQVVETTFPIFGLSDALIRLVIILLIIGFPLILVFAWLLELTADGLKLERNVDHSPSVVRQNVRQLDRIIIVVLTLSLGYFAIDKFVLDPTRDALRDESVAEQARNAALVESHGDKSIAVLPFVNMSSDKEQEYFSDGIAEDVLNLLTKIPELRVISRTSSFAYRGKEIDIPTVATQLNVAYILEGSVRKAGNEVRITAQLIETGSDSHLWSETYDRTPDDIFSTQDEIAAEVVKQLKLALLDAEDLKVRKTNPEAYALYLQARHVRAQNTSEAFVKALQLYQESLAIDPDYPEALDGLAEMYTYHGLMALMSEEEASRHARAAINRALAVDPDFGAGVASLGWFAAMYDHDLATAARHFERAMALDPTNLVIIDGAAYIAGAIGRLHTAVELLEYAVARDPTGPAGHYDLGLSYLKIGRLEDAESNVRTALRLNPGHVGAWALLGLVLLANGDTDAALDAIDQETFETVRLLGLALAYHDLRQQEETDSYLATLIDEHGEDAYLEIAMVFAWRGDNNNAFEWLNRAREYKRASLANVASTYPLRKMHDDSRWQPFLAKVGQSDAQLAAIEFDVQLPE